MRKISSHPGDNTCLFSFVQVSDTHCLRKYEKPRYSLAGTSFRIGKYRFHWRDSINSFPILQNTIEYINQEIKPDFLIHTGDITEGGKFSDLKGTKELLMNLNCSYYPLMGDNDLGDCSYSDFNRSECDYLKVFSQRCYSFNCQNWHIIILSVYPDDAELNWLRKDLSENAGKPTIFATHRLIIANFALWLIEKCLRIRLLMPRAGEVLKILENHPNVKLVLSGHCHTNFHWEKSGIDFISTTALVEASHQFKLFQVYRDRIAVTLFRANTAKEVFNKQWVSRAYKNLCPLSIL